MEGDLCSGGDEYRFEPDRILCPSKGTFLVNICQSCTPTSPRNPTAIILHLRHCAVLGFFADGFKKKRFLPKWYPIKYLSRLLVNCIIEMSWNVSVKFIYTKGKQFFSLIFVAAQCER